jgi:transforming growth factor-beta-induced protein
MTMLTGHTTKGDTTMRKTALSGIGAAAALALALGTAAPATAGPGKPGSDTITTIAAEDGRFTYLVAALEATGLDEVLDSTDSKFTVFAPTDAAFEKAADELFAAGLGDGTVPTLLNFLVVNDLADDVLLYHVNDGRRFANSVVPKVNNRSISTLLGPSLSVTPGGTVVDASAATSDAAIIIPNINASNGVIHAIDNVLVPLS